ncbi:hypothetical protein J4403_03355 [Candidatus Woesearchaeota archaeon]|nr:hypothetical protein [Candidatus Woesearchaeota archaeon]
METNIALILYVLLGAVAGMIYALRRIFVLETKIDVIDEKIVRVLMHQEKLIEKDLALDMRAAKKKSSKPKKKKRR